MSELHTYNLKPKFKMYAEEPETLRSIFEDMIEKTIGFKIRLYFEYEDSMQLKVYLPDDISEEEHEIVCEQMDLHIDEHFTNADNLFYRLTGSTFVHTRVETQYDDQNEEFMQAIEFYVPIPEV